MVILILGFVVLIGGLFYKYVDVDALIEVEKESKEFDDD